MKSWRRDLRRLFSVFHSPKRTLAEIGETPGVAVVVAAMLLLFAVTLAPRVIDTANPTFGSREVELFFLQPLVVIGWPFVASALYLFVFNLFGAEARYRVILSVSLHAMIGTGSNHLRSGSGRREQLRVAQLAPSSVLAFLRTPADR